MTGSKIRRRTSPSALRVGLSFASHAELRAKWLRNGAQWWSTVDPKPEHWDPQQQVDVVMSSHQR
jgi:hypothetical protein